MLYAILCYHSEAETNSWSKEKDDAVIAKRAIPQQKPTGASGDARRPSGLARADCQSQPEADCREQVRLFGMSCAQPHEPDCAVTSKGLCQ